MIKILYNKFDKQLISQLPLAEFEGKIVVIVNPKETKKAVDYLLKSEILGVDTETRPSFKRGRVHLVSLLQVSNMDTCFLFRLNYTGITSDIKRLLEDVTVPKVGLSLHDDVISLSKRANFTPGAFIDLQHHVKELGVEDLSLQKLYANFFGEKISKAVFEIEGKQRFHFENCTTTGGNGRIMIWIPDCLRTCIFCVY